MMKFPEDVDGWLTEAEGFALSAFSVGKTVLEIGSYKGRSSICMAQTAKEVHCVDPFDGRGTPHPNTDTYDEFLSNVIRYGVLDKVMVRDGTISDVGPNLKAQYDLAFIDGAHDYASVRQDTEWALRLLKPGGLIAYHDFHSTVNPGVDQAVHDLIGDGGRLLAMVGTVALVAPPDELLTGDLKKTKIVIVMPHAGAIRCAAAGRAFFESATLDPMVELAKIDMSSSVTTLNFNRLWSEALNLREAGFTHFAMLHDDVCPEPGWLDVLLGELIRHDADVVSAIAPIKSIHGLTSTALGWAPPNNIFRPLRRLTIHETFKLPETFSRADVDLEGPPVLFVNTGCWIADLRKPWVEKNCFRNVERLVCVNGKWKADCMSEDWAFSCDLHLWGAKVMATRKVPLYHGRPEFHNKQPWGAWETDEEYFQRVKAYKEFPGVERNSGDGGVEHREVAEREGGVQPGGAVEPSGVQ